LYILWVAARADFPRLWLPSTLTGTESLLPGVCLTPYVALSGFDYPLSGLLLYVPLNHFSGPSIPGVHPTESSSP
jgi:hypothetical protein